MKRPALGLLLVVALATAGSSLSTTAADAAAATRTIHLGGVPVTIGEATTQVITVNHRSGDHATVRLYRRIAGTWTLQGTATDGRIGYGGLVAGTERKQGSGTTPLGTYGLLYAFGTHPEVANWDLSYRRIGAWDYWVEDNASAYYNRWRNRYSAGFRWQLAPGAVNGSERLRSYPRQYEFSVVTSFNYTDQVRYRGAGIFLHVNGSGATAGCVSAPRWFLRDALARLDPKFAPVIAIGR